MILGHFDLNRKVCTCTMCSSLLTLHTCSDFFQRFPATQVLFRLLTLLASLTEYDLACFPHALFAVPSFSSCWLIFGANSTVLNSRIFSTRRHAVLPVTIIISLNILIHQVLEVTGISLFLHVASRGTGFNWPMAVAMETRNPHKKCLGHLRH